MLSDAARTAQQAADGLGVALGQIAKSIIFRRVSDDMAVLVVTSGDRRVDQKKVEAQVGPLARADAEFVKAKTGFSIGGVSPVAHAGPVVTLVDVDLFRFDTIWAAAGHPYAVFPLTPAQLCKMAGVVPGNVVEGVAGQPLEHGFRRLAERAAAVQKLALGADRAATQVHAGGSVGQALGVPSPCVSVCKMDNQRGLCQGCLRTLGEIRQWSSASEVVKLQIWQQIETRLAGQTA